VNSCPEITQCFKDVYAMDYKEPPADFFDDYFWPDGFDETVDEIPVVETPVHETPVYATPTHSA
jgi:hypothetical protein